MPLFFVGGRGSISDTVSLSNVVTLLYGSFYTEIGQNLVDFTKILLRSLEALQLDYRKDDQPFDSNPHFEALKKVVTEKESSFSNLRQIHLCENEKFFKIPSCWQNSRKRSYRSTDLI